MPDSVRGKMSFSWLNLHINQYSLKEGFDFFKEVRIKIMRRELLGIFAGIRLRLGLDGGLGL